MRFIYPAIIRKTETGTFRATFPDLQDCQAEGDTMDEVIERANEAALDWITVELETEEQLPPVSDIEDLELEEGAVTRNISVIIRLMDGWDE